MRTIFLVCLTVLLSFSSVSNHSSWAADSDLLNSESGTHEGYQHDADIARLKDIKNIGGLIEEYRKKNGHPPLSERSSRKNYVYIASDIQAKTIDHNYDEIDVTDVREFIAELEKGLGRKIELSFDPQISRANTKYVFYIYAVKPNQDYALMVFTHNKFSFSGSIAPYNNLIMVGKRSDESSGKTKVWPYKKLMKNKAYKQAIKEPMLKPGAFENIRKDVWKNERWGKAPADPETQKKYDSQRFKDIVAIEKLILSFYKKAGHYPFAKGPQGKLVDVGITKKKSYHPYDFGHKQFLGELRRVLGNSVTLPFDPDNRVYQYASNGQNYWVSTYMFHESPPVTTDQGNHYHKLEITNRPAIWQNQYRLKDVLRVMKFGPEKPEQQKEFIAALNERNFPVAKKLMKEGANPSPLCGFNYRCQPLAQAAREADFELMTFLIDNGADIDGYNSYFDVPLIYAFENENETDAIKSFRFLVEKGANVNLPNAFGMTPFLGIVMMYGNDPAFMNFMLQHGADVNRDFLVQTNQSKPGERNARPLHTAIENEHLEAVAILLANGANPLLLSYEGMTALELAELRGNQGIIDAIKSYAH